MSDTPETISLETSQTPNLNDLSHKELIARIQELEAEVARLRPVEQAAREVSAFLEGRRPGFHPAYPLEVLRVILNEAAPETSRLPVIRGGVPRRRSRKTEP